MESNGKGPKGHSERSGVLIKTLGGFNKGTSRRLKPIEGLLLSLVTLSLFVMAGIVFYDAVVVLFRVVSLLHGDAADHEKYVFAKMVSKFVSDVLLVVIAIELVETVQRQITHERFTLVLVHNFLVIGIVSAIRHLLAIGAELSLGVHETLDPALRSSLLWQIAANAGVVGVLLFGLWIVDRVKESPDPDSSEASGMKAASNGSARRLAGKKHAIRRGAPSRPQAKGARGT